MNYQEKVSTRADVRALYERVIANPAIRRYRGYTESKSYGWDCAAEDYIKKDGEVWFENPAYDPAFVPEGVSKSGDAELLDEQLAEKEQEIADLEADIADLQEQNEALELRAADAEARAKAAENERDEAKEALIELRRALVLVGELAGTK
ncbi:MAG: hypothetical protein IJX39_09595 [Clostridia bacterium]|nr:hypothetical protein [Clostridia bacterium]